MKDTLWKLFSKTGDIKYYLMFKSLEGEEVANRESSGNSNK